MPVKKKPAKKRPTSKEVDDSSLQGKLAQANARIESLERLLATKTETANKAIIAQGQLRSQLLAYHSDFDKERQDRFDITSNMTRQYKTLQEELIVHLNQSQEEVANLKDKLELARIEKESMIRDKDAIIASKNEEIESLKKKIEQMHLEFADMLQDTLIRMKEQVQRASHSFSSSYAVSESLNVVQQYFPDSLPEL
eukprot:TRINITY_DN7783_c0_g1_i1.p1 TRINITY_DN7783_c0_g1~~TRINITY_DN7783_c0_g1_i1.p1  ORF type:complete len:197 (+),score=62.83 TRINITY_DN7783_c0_g1_i1:33-623(+)